MVKCHVKTLGTESPMSFSNDPFLWMTLYTLPQFTTGEYSPLSVALEFIPHVFLCLFCLLSLHYTGIFNKYNTLSPMSSPSEYLTTEVV